MPAQLPVEAPVTMPAPETVDLPTPVIDPIEEIVDPVPEPALLPVDVAAIAPTPTSDPLPVYPPPVKTPPLTSPAPVLDPDLVDGLTPASTAPVRPCAISYELNLRPAVPLSGRPGARNGRIAMETSEAPRRAGTIAASCLALALAGCGGGGDGKPTAGRADQAQAEPMALAAALPDTGISVTTTDTSAPMDAESTTGPTAPPSGNPFAAPEPSDALPPTVPVGPTGPSSEPTGNSDGGDAGHEAGTDDELPTHDSNGTPYCD